MKKSTTDRGYGYSAHQVPLKQLFYNLIDGAECEWCGRPMYRDSSRNFDEATLEGDHNDDDGTGKPDKTKPPKRLIHRRCNRQKLDSLTKHGPEWYAKHGQDTHTPLDWPGGHTITW
ncbi:hypothetical protein [Corynebacterium qintianiae]|uniref:hypothetical protein n=1 Tax=Corynebacterium qintianiae TaxID=2709392 RepID=UPI0013EE0774|nr:hypothetical protein [Corynebacterium qintianiae]